MPSLTPYVLPTPRARRTPDLGALTTLVPPELVGSVLANAGVRTRRMRRLPMHLVVYLILAMALFPSVGYRGLQSEIQGAWQLAGAAPWRMVANSAISQARDRLPWQVMRNLFFALVAPQAGPTDGRWRDHRLVALDGASMEMADSPENETAFGGPVGKNRQRVGFPQLRIVALVCCQTRLALAAEVGGFARGEGRLAAELVGSVEQGMLVLADRLFVGVELLAMIGGAGGEVLWRVKSGVATRPIKGGVLKDGTYLAQLKARSHRGRGWMTGKRPQPVTVRIIEFTLNGRPQRLLTSLLDPDQAPARELIALYCQRWQVETFYRECKGDEQGRRQVLRSRTPNGVNQEIWACLIVHYLVRWLTREVADHSQLEDPKCISFKQAVEFIHKRLEPNLRLALPRLLGWAIAALTPRTAQVDRSRPERTNPRQLRRRPYRYLTRAGPAVALSVAPASIELQPYRCSQAA